MTPFHIAIFYLACVIIGVLVGYHVAAYERRRRQKAAEPLRGKDLHKIENKTLQQVADALDRDRRDRHPPDGKAYVTPMYRPHLGLIPTDRVNLERPFMTRKALVASALAHEQELVNRSAALRAEDALRCPVTQARQTTLWDIIPAPADLNKPAVG